MIFMVKDYNPGRFLHLKYSILKLRFILVLFSEFLNFWCEISIKLLHKLNVTARMLNIIMLKSDPRIVGSNLSRTI
jgi:hypothetical protein